jgi:hypothetical protein
VCAQLWLLHYFPIEFNFKWLKMANELNDSR